MSFIMAAHWPSHGMSAVCKLQPHAPRLASQFSLSTCPAKVQAWDWSQDDRHGLMIFTKSGLCSTRAAKVPETLSSDVPMTDTEESWARATNENESGQDLSNVQLFSLLAFMLSLLELNVACN